MSQWPGALQVDSTCTLIEAVGRLDAAPDAPGLMIYSGGHDALPVSRRIVISGLAQTLSTSGASHLLLADLLAQWSAPMLELSPSLTLDEAIRFAIDRTPAARYEPILIRDDHTAPLMVDLRVLLLAQCEALERAVTEVGNARIAAEAAAAARTRFLISMSHEIRTPMTAIVGFAELIAAGSLSVADRNEHCEAVRRNASHLMAVINDLLDASKIESGKMTVEHIPCDPLACVEEAMDILRPAAYSKGLGFSRDIRGEIPGTIIADPLRLRQILLNLLSNAIKFTSSGSITVLISASGNTLQISVADTGHGMTPQQCISAFESFSQADQTISRRFGGSGLGLSISRQLAALMGGALTCESTPGRGSTFTLTLPCSTAGISIADAPSRRHAEPPGNQASQPLRGVRILLADDAADIRRLLQTLLAQAGAEVITACDGLAAVQTALAATEPEAPRIDLVLMDSEMPLLDGIQATRILRAKQFTAPIIALTAHNTHAHRGLCLDAGCNDLLVKPADRAALIHAVAQWALHTRAAAA
jgi:signal transduction histidine kinase/ActR/RegA family two-component response regulator